MLELRLTRLSTGLTVKSLFQHAYPPEQHVSPDRIQIDMILALRSETF